MTKPIFAPAMVISDVTSMYDLWRQNKLTQAKLSSTWLLETTDLRLIESNTTLREGRGNPIRVSKICNPRVGSWMLKILDTRMGFPSSSLNVVIDYVSYLKICKICLNRTLDATFLYCLALTFCDVIDELLPEWACLTLQGGTKFLLTSKLADILVSRVRKTCEFDGKKTGK